MKDLADQLVPRVNTQKSHIKCVAAFHNPVHLYTKKLSSTLNDTIINCLPITVRQPFFQSRASLSSKKRMTRTKRPQPSSTSSLTTSPTWQRSTPVILWNMKTLPQQSEWESNQFKVLRKLDRTTTLQSPAQKHHPKNQSLLHMWIQPLHMEWLNHVL